MLVASMVFATDVDECSTSNGGCDQVCTNTVGSFNCSCNDGFSLNMDGATCDGLCSANVSIKILINVCLIKLCYRH